MALDPYLVSPVDTSNDTRNVMIALANRTNPMASLLSGTGDKLGTFAKTLTDYNTGNLTTKLKTMNEDQLREAFNDNKGIYDLFTNLGSGYEVDKNNSDLLNAWELAKNRDLANMEKAYKNLDVMSKPDGEHMVANMSPEEALNLLNYKDRGSEYTRKLDELQSKQVGNEISKELPSIIDDYAEKRGISPQEIYKNKSFLEQIANNLATEWGYTGKPIKHENLSLPNLSSGDDRTQQDDIVKYNSAREANNFYTALDNKEFSSVQEAEAYANNSSTNFMYDRDRIAKHFSYRSVDDALYEIFPNGIPKIDFTSEGSVSNFLAGLSTIKARARNNAIRYGVENQNTIDDAITDRIVNNLTDANAVVGTMAEAEKSLVNETIKNVFESLGGNDHGLADMYTNGDSKLKYTDKSNLNNAAKTVLLNYIDNNNPELARILRNNNQLNMRILNPMINVIVAQAETTKKDASEEDKEDIIKNVLTDQNALQVPITTYLQAFSDNSIMINVMSKKSQRKLEGNYR